VKWGFDSGVGYFSAPLIPGWKDMGLAQHFQITVTINKRSNVNRFVEYNQQAFE
jgi:hypothetical protein